MTLTPDRLIAHRGDQSRFPENTLDSIKAALNAGAIYVETDVQLSRESTPFLFHDREMTRLTGQPGHVHQLSDHKISQRRIHETYSIPDLSAACDLLRQYPKATLFIEAKRIAIDHFGVETMFRRISDTVGSLKNRCPLISFSLPFVKHAQHAGWPLTGAIFDRKSPPGPLFGKEGEALDYVFMEIGLYRNHPQWRFADSRLALYETSDPELANELLNQGVGLIETNVFGKFTRHA